MYNNDVNNERIIFNIGKCCLNILFLLRLKKNFMWLVWKIENN